MRHGPFGAALVLACLVATGCGAAAYNEQMGYAQVYFEWQQLKIGSLALDASHRVETTSSSVSYTPPAPLELARIVNAEGELAFPQTSVPEGSTREANGSVASEPPPVDWTIGRFDLREFRPTGLRAVFHAPESEEGEPALLFLAVYDPRDEEAEQQAAAAGEPQRPRPRRVPLDPEETLEERTERELAELLGEPVDLAPNDESFPGSETLELYRQLGMIAPAPLRCSEFRMALNEDGRPAAAGENAAIEVIGYMLPGAAATVGSENGEPQPTQVLLVFFVPQARMNELAVDVSTSAGLPAQVSASPIEFSLETLGISGGAGGGFGPAVGGSAL